VKITLSKAQWKFIGKQAGWTTPTMEENQRTVDRALEREDRLEWEKEHLPQIDLDVKREESAQGLPVNEENEQPSIKPISRNVWEYKQHTIELYEDKESGNAKLYWEVIKPSGENVTPNVSSYGSTVQDVCTWIDDDYPDAQ
jgi:hypothetical protein